MENVFDPKTQLLEFLPEYLVDYPNLTVIKGYAAGIDVLQIDLANCPQELMQHYYIERDLKHLFNIIDKLV